jgi:hypothetical protein
LTLIVWKKYALTHYVWKANVLALIFRKVHTVAGVIWTPHALTIIIWKEYALTLCVWKANALALVVRMPNAVAHLVWTVGICLAIHHSEGGATL